MNKILFLIVILFSINAYAKCTDKPIRIAIVDTGFGFKSKGQEARLCKYGHKDFTEEQKFSDPTNDKLKVPLDINGHGTNIVGIIEGYAKEAHINYCIVVLKYYTRDGMHNLRNTINAFNYASDMRIDYINYSAGGTEPSNSEKSAVKRFLNGGGILIVSAGNDGTNLDLYGYFPAQYDKRTIVVGSLNKRGSRLLSSNYGTIVNRWEIGIDVIGYGISMSGTSQAAASATGKIVSQNTNKCDRIK